MKSNQIVIIGAGLGGMAAAITLASKGYRVSIYEKNAHPGGKLNFLSREGFRFDLGPSILSMPFIFKDLFLLAGKRFEEYVPIEQLDIHWRNFFEDGTQIDLVRDYGKQKELFQKLSPAAPKEFLDFLNYSQNQFSLIKRIYFRTGADTISDAVRYTPLWDLWGADLFSSMRTSIESRFSNLHLRDVFSYFSKYVGSSPYNAPGFLILLPWIQYCFGLWYVKNGMVNLARGMSKLLGELNVELNLNTEVNRLLVSDGKVAGVMLNNGKQIPARIVVSNMEVIPTHKELLQAPPEQMKRFRRFEPSCSGLVVHLGVNRIYSQLAHHNFFYSLNSRKNFRSVYEEYKLPDDPTIYLVAPVRTDSTLAPQGYDIIKLLPHLPHLNDVHSYTQHDYELYKNHLIDKLERMGLTDLRKHIVVEEIITPLDIKRMYYSTSGSIYGVVSDLWKNFGFKAPKKSQLYSNLFFAGGSVNPGGGLPMVTLGGMHTGHLIEKQFPIKDFL
jgi:diapolycopene oxygenase